MKNPLTLIILDGYGLSDSKLGNAILDAKTPNLDEIFAENPTTVLGCGGLDVGLPEGQMGNSEVGHTNMGAGRVVYQELTRISKSVIDGDFFENTTLLDSVSNAKAHNSAFHIMGLLSDGGVHSHMEHIYALLEMAKSNGLKDVYVHCFMDGRDVSPNSGTQYIKDILGKMDEIGVGKIATVVGRYYAMDRDKRYDRVMSAYNALVLGEGYKVTDDVLGCIEESYSAGITDEFIKPIVCCKEGIIKQDDSVIFANFRPDRAREITRALVDEGFDGFERKNGYFPLHYTCMTQYDASMPNVKVAFRPVSLKNTFGEYIAEHGLTQLRIAETEKYAHVTFFFNGGIEEPYAGEDRVLIQSPDVATYDLKPEMSAHEVTDAAVERIKSGKYDVIILNFANCDMIGHTGVISAAIRAVEVVDQCVGRVVDAVKEMGGIALITADHGNADQMLEADGVTPITSHSTNPVPFTAVGFKGKLKSGVLADIAPTMLDLLGLDKPADMSGETLIS